MRNEQTKIEIIAPSVEEAIEKGLSELGLTQDEVDIEILDEGKRNIFRFATRQARVRLRIKNELLEDIDQEDSVIEVQTEVEEESFSELFSAMQDNLEDPLDITRSVIQELLNRMGIKADVTVEYGEKGNGHVNPILANIEGNDLSFLIGRKSEIINALQYITSLMVGNKLNRWTPIQIDVQNYRERRERELKKLARRMAEQVVSSGRKQFLEPMPANERRIIHMELHDDPRVITESTGEDPYRKVVISLKR